MESKKNLSVKLNIHNPALEKEFKLTVKGITGYHLMSSGDDHPSDLMVLALDGAPEDDFMRIQMLLSEDKTREIFLVAKEPDPELLMRAMRLGVKEVFPLPLDTSDVHTALERFAQRSQITAPVPAAKKGQVISIIGGKGGVGATTVAVNLAISLGRSHKGASVALLDMNTLFGEIPLFMEIKPQFHWGDLTKNINRLDETFLMNLLSKHGTGVHVLPSPGYLNGHQRPTPQIMHQLLELMKTMFDYVIIDCGQATNDTALKTFALSTHLLVVATPSLPCLANTHKLLSSITGLGFVEQSRTKIILNRYTKRGDISAEDAKAGLDREIFWMIPNDYLTTMAAINQGRPLAEIAPKSKIALNFDQLAGNLMPEEQKPAKKRWRLFGS